VQPGQTPGGRSPLSPRRSAAGVLRPRCESAPKSYRHNLRGGLKRFQATRRGRNIPRVSYHARLPAMGTSSHLGTHLCCLPIHYGESTGSVPEPSSLLLLGSGVLRICCRNAPPPEDVLLLPEQRITPEPQASAFLFLASTRYVEKAAWSSDGQRGATADSKAIASQLGCSPRRSASPSSPRRPGWR
jgi:hypothetical protein